MAMAFTRGSDGVLGGSFLIFEGARGDVGNSRRWDGMNVGWKLLKEENDKERRKGSGPLRVCCG